MVDDDLRVVVHEVRDRRLDGKRDPLEDDRASVGEVHLNIAGAVTDDVLVKFT